MSRGYLLGQRLAKRRNAPVGAVARLAVAHGTHGGLLDVGRRRQVHVAEVEGVDNVALGGVRGGLGGHGEGRLGAKSSDAISHLHTVPPSQGT